MEPSVKYIRFSILEVIIMPNNLLANPEYYENIDLDSIETEKQVIDIIKQFLQSNVNDINDGYFNDIVDDLENTDNREIRFDDNKTHTEVHGKSDERIVYGAFRYREYVEHHPQTMWTYTFEIIETEFGLYMATESWGWLKGTNLSNRVDRIFK